MAPRVPSRKPEPTEPVTWYKVVAPQFPVTPRLPEANVATEVEADGARRALFGSIDAIAEKERRKGQQVNVELPDVRRMRREAAEAAHGIVGEAMEQARVIVEESRAEGFKRGYEGGYAAGEQEAMRQLTQRADDEREAYQQDISAFIATIEGTSRRAWLEMEPEISGLVFEIAKKVIKMEVVINRDAAIEVIKNTLRRVADTTSLRIRVHADDLQTVRANREELYTLVDNIRQVEIVEDRRVGPGGCIVETDAGTIDARIESQIEEVRKLLAQTSYEATG